MKDIAAQTDAVKSMMTWDPPVYGQFGMKPELVNYASDDERLWVPIEPNVWYRPLFFDMTTGSHCEILRVKRGGILSRHRHPTPVHGFVIKGEWRYLEHSWVAKAGSHVYEPPGEEHTLTCDNDDEMQTFFFIDGPVLYVDENNVVTYVEDNLGLIRQCREHFAANGLGADFVDALIR